MRKNINHKSRLKIPWDKKENRTSMQEFLYNHYKKSYDEHHPVLAETGEAELINAYVPAECPYCSSIMMKMNGFTRNGVQRCKCSYCRQTFTPVTQTILKVIKYLSANG